MLPTTIRICFGLLLLTTVIHGISKELKEQLNNMALNGDLIDGIFKLVEYISEGGFGVVYKGERIEKNRNRTVALKFVKMKHKSETDKEFTIYTYLNAIDNPKIESYGIPTIYYYKKYDQHMLMAMTFFDGGDLIDVAQFGVFDLSEEEHTINSLLVFRDFVRTSKYIHCKGVRHDDIKPENIMLRKHRTYLIDFNLSTKMLERGLSGTLEFFSRRTHRSELRTALDDWESFLYTMCRLNGIALKWFNDKIFEGLTESETSAEYGRLKKNTKRTIRRIEKDVKWEPLKTVYVAFANECFKQNGSFPDYNAIDDVITAQIKNVVKPPEQAFYTWLTPKNKQEANDELIENPLPNVKDSILDPQSIDFEHFKYPAVDLKYFNKTYLTKFTKAASKVINKVIGSVRVG